MPRASSRSSPARRPAAPASPSTSGPASGSAIERAQHAQLERERDELLLGAVVEVALDAPAGLVGGLDDPQARHAQLLHARAQVGLQALVVDGQRRRRRGGLRRARGSCPAPRRGRSPRRGARRCSTAVHARPDPGSGSATGWPASSTKRLAVGQPVGDRHRAVAEALGQQLAHRPARRGARAPAARAPIVHSTRVRARRASRSRSTAAGRRPARAGRGRAPGPSAPRARSSRSSPRPPTPCTPRLRISASSASGHERDDAQPGDQQRLGGQQRDHPPQRRGRRGRRASAATGCPPSRHAPRHAAGCACPGSGWPRAGRAARAAGRRPRRPAAAAARSRRRSARRRATSASTASAPRIAIGTLTTR